MSTTAEIAISQLVHLARQGAEELQKKHTELFELLRTIVCALPQIPRSVSFQRSITIIKLQLENEPEDLDSFRTEQKEAILLTIRKICQAFSQSEIPLAFQRILKLIVGRPQEAMQTLQTHKHILLDSSSGTLSFSPQVEEELDYELFEAIIENLNAPVLEQIKFFPLQRYPKLANAPALLVRKCPNLSFATFYNLPPPFFNHTLNGIRVNMELLKAVSPTYFTPLWDVGMKESENKTTGQTILPGLDMAAFRSFHQLLLGEEVIESDVNRLIALAEFLDEIDVVGCKEIERRYITTFTQTVSQYKDDLHEYDTIKSLIAGFTPLFSRGYFLGLQETLCSLIDPLDLPQEMTDEIAEEYREIFLFIASVFEWQDALCVMDTIAILQNHLPKASSPAERTRFEEEIKSLREKKWDYTAFLLHYQSLARCDSERHQLLLEIRRAHREETQAFKLHRRVVQFIYNGLEGRLLLFTEAVSTFYKMRPLQEK